MAAPESQFQTAGLNVPYSFTPTHYTPTAVNVPSQTGEILAGAGTTALNAAKNVQTALQTSPLNPMVKAQMDAARASAQTGQAQLAWAADPSNPYRRWLIETDGQGNARVRAGFEGTPTFQQKLDPYGDGDGNGQKPGKPNDPDRPATKPVVSAPPAPGQPVARQQGFEASEYPATPPASTQPAVVAPPTDASKANEQPPLPNQASASPFRPGVAANAPAPNAFTGPNQAQTAAAVKEALSRNQFASSEQGIPANYQPPSTYPTIASDQGGAQGAPAQQGAAQPQVEPGGIMDQYAKGYAQGQEQKRQVDLSNWQEQTARQTAPMTAADAMDWMKQRTTLVTGATRLDHGGPNGEPAFAFHMKAPDGKPGGTNIVPVSQMVQNGAGPTVAAQNTSVVLSQGNKLRQQQGAQQVAPGAPGGTPPGTFLNPATGSIEPIQQSGVPSAQFAAANQAQLPQGGAYNAPPTYGAPPPGAPPAAPSIPSAGALGAAQQQAAQYAATGEVPPAAPGVQAARQPLTDIYGNPMGAYTNVASKGGLTPDQLTAQTASAGQPGQSALPAAYTQPAPLLSDADKREMENAVTDPNAKPVGDVDPETGDRPMGNKGGFYWYRDDANDGKWYTRLPGTSSTWTQSRWYYGTPGYAEYPLKETVVNSNLEKAAMSIPGINLSHSDIAGMPMDKKQAYLDYAKWYEQSKGSHSNDETNKVLQNRENEIRQANQILDIMDAAPNPAQYGKATGESEKRWSEQQTQMANPDIGLTGELGRAWGHLQDFLTQAQHHSLYQDMQTAVTNLGAGLKGPGWQPTSGQMTPEKPGVDINLPIPIGKWVLPFGYHQTGTAAHEDPLDIPAIQDITQDGISQAEKRQRVVQLRDTLVKQYGDEIHLANLDNERVDKHHMDNKLALANDAHSLSPSDNKYRGPDGSVVNPYAPPESAKSRSQLETELRASGALPKGSTVPQALPGFTPAASPKAQASVQPSPTPYHPTNQAAYDAIPMHKQYVHPVTGQLTFKGGPPK
jgi:hypothetical protein